MHEAMPVPTQAPMPSQVRVMTLLPIHVVAGQGWVDRAHMPPVVHSPVMALHPAPPVQSGSEPVTTGEQTPVGFAHERQAPSHEATVQQVLSTQLPVAHSVPALQVAPAPFL